MRRIGCALIDDLRGTVRKGTVCDIGVTGNPTDIRGAPVNVGFGLQIENIAVRVCRLGQIAAGGVQNTLRFSGGSRGVKNEQRVFCFKALGLVVSTRNRHGIVPPEVSILGPIHFTGSTLHHEHLFDRGAVVALQSLVDGRLERRRFAFAVAAIRCNHQLGVCVLDARGK